MKKLDILISIVFLIITWGTVEYGLHWFYGPFIVSATYAAEERVLIEKSRLAEKKLRAAGNENDQDQVALIKEEILTLQNQRNDLTQSLFHERAFFYNRYIITFFILALLFGLASLFAWFMFHIELLASVFFGLGLVLLARAYIAYWPYIGYGTGFIILGITSTILLATIMYRLNNRN